MAKNNNYGNYILSDALVDYKLFGYNKRDLTQYKHQFVSKNKLTIQYLDIHVERLNPNPYIRNLPFYKTVCDICGNTFWRKKSYDKYKRNMCGYKCQGDALYNNVKKRTFENPGINSYGYPCFVDRGRQITCHRYAMELYLGRKLKTEELIHHIDMDKLNYDISNLYLTNRDSHVTIHGTYNELCSELINNYDKYSGIEFNRKKGIYYLIKKEK